MEPVPNATSAHGFSRFMRSSKVGVELEDVDFIAGDFGDPREAG